MLNKLTAISPVDGRYRNTTETLADYFSEQALIRYRIRVEVEYFIALCEIPLPQLAGIDRTKFAALRALYLDFSPADAERVKQIESVTNHDVKAIEYIIKEKMDTLGLEAYKEKFATPYQAAELGFIDEIIYPRQTRKRLIQALEMTENKMQTNPPKKHGNMPL